MITNPIKYSSRTFASILSDINSDSELTDKPNWWKRLWAGIGDVLSMWLNSMVNLVFLRTSYTVQSVADLCQLIDYALSAQTTSSGTELFFVKTSSGTGVFPFTLSKADIIARNTGSLVVSSKRFEGRNDVVFTLVQEIIPSTSINTGTSIFTVATNFLYTGHKVRFTTSNTLPVPLALNTDYYMIYLSPTTIRLASSLSNAFAGTYIPITNAGIGNQTMTLYSKTITMYQQTSLAQDIVIGTSDGITAFQEFNLPDKFVLKDTLTITINSITWTLVTTFVDSISTDKVFKIIPKSNNQFSIRFGDGTYGMIPPAFDIFAGYAYGGGASSNVNALNSVSNYGGSDSNISGVTNTTIFSGGAGSEDLNHAKNLAPLLLKTRDRFITVQDGIALVLAYGGITQCQIVGNKYGLLTCEVIGIASGGGNPSNTLKSAIQQFLIDRTILESIDVRFVDSTITVIAVTSAVKPKAGHVYTNGIDKYFRLAWQLFLTETGKQIQDTYLGSGIVSAVTLINQIFSASFGASDYTQISILLANLTPRQFGDLIEESDIFSYIQSNVLGIEYMTISSFTGSLPLTLAADEITTPGTLTLSGL
jgi:hypothetical protein